MFYLVLCFTLTSILASETLKDLTTSGHPSGNFTFLYESEGKYHVAQSKIYHPVPVTSIFHQEINDTIQTVNRDLLSLRELLKTELNQKTLLRALSSAEQGLEKLQKIVNLELPKRTKIKVVQLVQSLHNIRVTVISRLEPTISELKEYLTSVQNDKRQMNKITLSVESYEEIVRIVVKLVKIVRSIGQRNISKVMLERLKHLENLLKEYELIVLVNINGKNINKANENHEKSIKSELQTKNSSYSESVIDENMITQLLNETSLRMELKNKTEYNLTAEFNGAVDVLKRNIEYIEKNIVSANKDSVIVGFSNELNQIESNLKLFEAANTKLNLKLNINSLLERVGRLRIVVEKALREKQDSPIEEYETGNKPFDLQKYQDVFVKCNSSINTADTVDNKIKRLEKSIKNIQIEYETFNDGNLNINFTVLINKIENVLGELYLIIKEVIPENLYEKMERLNENINNYQDKFNITIVQNYQHKMPPESIKDIFEQITSLADEVEHITNLVNAKSSLSIASQIKDRLVEMQKELNSLDGKRLPYYMITSIKILMTKITRIVKTINELQSVNTQLQSLDRELISLKDQLKYKKHLHQINEKVQIIMDDLSELSVKNIPRYMLDEIDQMSNDIAVFMTEYEATSKTEEDIFNKTVNGFKEEFDRLKEQYSSESNMEMQSLQEIQRLTKLVLKQLEEQSAKYTSTASSERVQDLKKYIRTFEKQINQKIKEKEEEKKNPENIWDETVFTFQNAEKYIKHLETKLTKIKTNFLFESELPKLTKMYYEVDRLRSEAQMMSFRKFLPKLQSRIKDFLSSCDFVIQIIEQRLRKAIDRNPEFKNYNTPKPNHNRFSVIQVKETELKIKKLKFHLGNFKYMLTIENNVTNLMSIYCKVEHILAEVRVLQLEGFPQDFEYVISTFKEELEQVLYNVEQRIHKHIVKESIKQGGKGIENGSKNDLKLVESRVDETFNELKYLRTQLNPKQAQPQLKLRLKLLVELLDLIQDESLPVYLKDKIKTVQHVAGDLKTKVEENYSKFYKPSNDFESVEVMIKLRVDALEKTLQILQNQFLLENDHSAVVQRHFEIIKILEDISKLRGQNVPEELKTRIYVIQENTENIKQATEQFIKLRILNPITDCIDDILLQLDRHSTWMILRPLTRRRVRAAKEDLNSLREEIKTLTNYALIEEIYRHLNGILYRLEDLRGYHLSDAMANAITNFSTHVKYLNKKRLSGKEESSNE